MAMSRSVGVLLAHGMDVQPEDDTEPSLGDPLLAFASQWLYGRGIRRDDECECRGNQWMPRHAHALRQEPCASTDAPEALNTGGTLRP
jgi:hypothetical protein